MGSSVSLLACCGCGPKPPDANLVRDANVAFNAGIIAFNAGDNAAAIAQLTAALQSDTIDGDMVGEAYILRAVAHARSGDFATAHSDLDQAELGAPEDRVYAARSYVFDREGKTTEAGRAMRNARRANPNVQIFKD